MVSSKFIGNQEEDGTREATLTVEGIDCSVVLERGDS